ncbi:hypothetical protein K432DRAFT_411456 [Lepidopterella palustris CBS 459.81]|uniref:PAS domain-containing protein n=1 Tax=Lepidopterella palustris CBS 459.81 TaxID=1314670 RepID=A0A8E2DWD9_9PEZI|nr:hypothetical protein K432DRAFT_411456 [Lepidopterella palustris CBS 459.81]
METTFITIHDLTEDARILYSSDSIVDILGHTPDEVVNRSCWDFFHPEEIPVARRLHNRGVELDKAAVLVYCKIKNRQGQWIGCECCFSVVYDVMVCCTSIYRRGMSSQKRAVEAPIVRRLFSSSPKDPRYHMLSHLSSKFNLSPKEQTHEPRAALFLNRFTRTLTIMYATNGIEQIIGISGEAMKGRSFYYCIQENCLEDAVRCLETAKGNDSIAYLRFWFRDPRQDDQTDTNTNTSESEDETMTDFNGSEDEGEGGVNLGDPSGTTSSNEHDSNGTSLAQTGPISSRSAGVSSDESLSASRIHSGDSSNPPDTHEVVFGHPHNALSSTSSISEGEHHNVPIELEAVVSCTSDGLVVCLRRARPMIPQSAQPQIQAAQPQYRNGIFAAPWAPEPMFLPPLPQPPPYPLGAAHPAMYRMGLAGQQGHHGHHGYHGHQQQVGPSQADFMNSIRDVAVFAWALTGINGSLAEYSRGKPTGESQPPEGFPIWAPEPGEIPSAAPSGYVSGPGSNQYCSPGSRDPFGDPGMGSGGSSRSSAGGRFY